MKTIYVLAKGTKEDWLVYVDHQGREVNVDTVNRGEQLWMKTQDCLEMLKGFKRTMFLMTHDGKTVHFITTDEIRLTLTHNDTLGNQVNIDPATTVRDLISHNINSIGSTLKSLTKYDSKNIIMQTMLTTEDPDTLLIDIAFDLCAKISLPGQLHLFNRSFSTRRDGPHLGIAVFTKSPNDLEQLRIS